MCAGGSSKCHRLDIREHGGEDLERRWLSYIISSLYCCEISSLSITTRTTIAFAFLIGTIYIPNFTLVLLSAVLYAGESLQNPICPPNYRTIGDSCVNPGQGACCGGEHHGVVSE